MLLIIIALVVLYAIIGLTVAVVTNIQLLPEEETLFFIALGWPLCVVIFIAIFILYLGTKFIILVSDMVEKLLSKKIL